MTQTMQLYWLYGFASENDREPTLGFFAVAESATEAVKLANDLPMAKAMARIVEGQRKPLPDHVAPEPCSAGCAPHRICKILWEMGGGG